MHDDTPTQPSFPGPEEPYQPEAALPAGQDYDQTPPIPPIPPMPPSRPQGRGFWGRRRTRWLIAGGAALVLLLAIASGVAFAAHQNAASAAPAATSSTNIPAAPRKNEVYTVVAVNGTTISATASSGVGATITTTTHTKITRGGQPATLSDLTTGTKFRVRGKMQSDGSITAQRIEIVVPEAKGTITAINGDTLTIQTRKKTITVLITSSTVIVDATTHATTTASSLTIGETVTIQAQPNGDGTYTALRILAGTPQQPATASPTASSSPTA